MEGDRIREFERRAVRFVLEKGKKIKESVASFAGPKGPQAGGSSMPVEVMSRRKQQLEQMGGQNTGGMFDIIYKKRREREDALKNIE